MEVLLNALNQISSISVSLQHFLLEKTQFDTLRKNEYLIRAGTFATRLYFVNKGLLRSYVKENDKEITHAIVKEYQIIVSVSSFFLQLPSKGYVQAIENSELISISQKDLQFCYANYPESKAIAIEVMNKSFIEGEKRETLLKIKDATARYRATLDQFPELVQRVPIRYLASYLDMNFETLSRIRSRIH
jgi:CRP-like cAMP-binding protein